jgi:Zn-dependent protease with chaperone function
MWTALVLCAVHVNASDGSSSCQGINEGDTSTSTLSTHQIAPESGGKPKRPSKYDVNRIGQRSIGKSINLYSLMRERSLGEAKAAEIDPQTKFVTDPKIKDYITHLGQKIVRKSDSQVPFTVKVIDAGNPTTFSLPGGFLYVDVALILEVDNEAELAGLMAHEIAHVAARHSTRLATRRYALDALLTLPIERIIGPAALLARQVGLVPLEKKFNRGTEFEADLLGIEYQYAAGYDPQAYVEALEKLDNTETQGSADASGHRPKASFFGWMGHHLARAYADYPTTESRVLRLQQEISTLLPCREDYVLDTEEFQEVRAQLRAERLVLHRRRTGDDANDGAILLRRPSAE